MEDAVSDDEHIDDDVSGKFYIVHACQLSSLNYLDELTHPFVDEQTGEAASSLQPRVFRRRIRSASATRGPLLANTTLTVLRFFD
jgi:hypothetical protein